MIWFKLNVKIVEIFVILLKAIVRFGVKEWKRISSSLVDWRTSEEEIVKQPIRTETHRLFNWMTKFVIENRLFFAKRQHTIQKISYRVNSGTVKDYFTQTEGKCLNLNLGAKRETLKNNKNFFTRFFFWRKTDFELFISL